jgi:pimeloyl-ACP methyl ester carboxylesterase
MNTRRVLLVHGMGSDPTWWNPFLAPLQQHGLAPVALSLPPLAVAGAEGWVNAVITHIANEPTALVGHSLGAAVCIAVALQRPVERLVALSLPAFVAGFTPAPPRTDLPPATVAATARFLRATIANAGQLLGRAVLVLGENDPAAPLVHARQLPLPVTVIAGAGHQLNRYPQAVSIVTELLVIEPTGTVRGGGRAGAGHPTDRGA